jgi:hypothetical protein
MTEHDPLVVAAIAAAWLIVLVIVGRRWVF